MKGALAFSIPSPKHCVKNRVRFYRCAPVIGFSGVLVAQPATSRA